MKIKFLLASIYLLSHLDSISQDFQLRINDTLINISVDEEQKVIIKGNTIRFLLISKDTMEFKEPTFTFKYPKENPPSKLLVDSTIEQFTIVTAEGSGIILQHFLSLNPESLSEIMLREITKENIEY